MKIISTVWFTQMGLPPTIGIVIGEDDITKERKAYIGTGAGYDEGADAEKIAETGAPLYLTHVEQVIKALKEKR